MTCIPTPHDAPGKTGNRLVTLQIILLVLAVFSLVTQGNLVSFIFNAAWVAALSIGIHGARTRQKGMLVSYGVTAGVTVVFEMLVLAAVGILLIVKRNDIGHMIAQASEHNSPHHHGGPGYEEPMEEVPHMVAAEELHAPKHANAVGHQPASMAESAVHHMTKAMHKMCHKGGVSAEHAPTAVYVMLGVSLVLFVAVWLLVAFIKVKTMKLSFHMKNQLRAAELAEARGTRLSAPMPAKGSAVEFVAAPQPRTTKAGYEQFMPKPSQV